MAQFLFEADLHGLLKLDTPIPNAPPARWQRKAKESGPGPSPVGVSPMKPANRSHSFSKTPSKTPGERRPPAAEVECRSLAQAALLVCSHEALASLPQQLAVQAGGGGLCSWQLPTSFQHEGQSSEHWGWRTADPPAEPWWHSCMLGQVWAGCQLTLYIL